MENEGVLCFKLKLKGNLFAEGLLSKEDLIELIRQSEECQVEPTHSTLLEMARRKKIRNHTILTKYELKKALDFPSEDKPRSRSYIFSNSPEVGFYTSCSDISQKLPQKFSKVAQKLLISRKSCSKVAFSQLKKISFYY